MVPSYRYFLHSADEKGSKACQGFKNMSEMEMHLNFDRVSASVKCNQGMNCFSNGGVLAARNQNKNYALFFCEGRLSNLIFVVEGITLCLCFVSSSSIISQ